MGCLRRQRTWYQCVKGSVGAVDNQTVCPVPIKATSNQNASPCTVPDCSMWNSKGISILCSSVSSVEPKSEIKVKGKIKKLN